MSAGAAATARGPGGRRFDVVLCDLDGTLVDSLADIAAAAHAVRAACDLPPLTEARVRSFIGDGARRLVARTLLDELDPDIDRALLDRGYQIFRESYAQGLCQQTRPYAGVLDALSALRGHGLRLGVVTNKALEFTLPILAGLDLARYFEVVVGGDSLPQAKPHAAPLLYALQRLQCPPERALMVGDGPHDLLAAHAAGCPAVLVSYGYGHAEAHAADVQPLRVVDSLLELVGLIADD